MPGKAFVDSNVLLYVFSPDAQKADRAEEVLRQRPVISVQVLNEVMNVMRRKFGQSWPEVEEFLGTVESLCTVEPLTMESHLEGRRIARRHGLSTYDAMIASSALLAGCEVLWSEDMHDGLVIEGQLKITNPFSH